MARSATFRSRAPGAARAPRGGRAAATAAPLLARAIQCSVGREPIDTILLHPFAVVLTLAIQWTALLRRRFGQATEWRGRAYLAEN